MNTTISSDPVADMLTRIRNAIAVHKAEVRLPHSKMKESIARLLQANKYINDVTVEGEKVSKILTLTLNDSRSNARITEISRISTPGARQYTNAREIPRVKRGRGIVIISTSKGLMSGEDARKQALGGELICEVY